MAAESAIAANGTVAVWSPARQRRRTAQLHMHDRHLLLALGDGLLALSAVPGAVLLWHGVLSQPVRLDWFMPGYFAVVWVTSLVLVDGYSLRIPISRMQSLSAVAKSAPIVVSLTFALFFALPYHVNRPVALLSASLGAAAILSFRFTVARFLLHRAFALRAIVIGGERASVELGDALRGAQHEFKVVGTLTFDGDDMDFVSTRLDLLRERMEETGATEVVVSDDAMPFTSLIEACVQDGIRVTMISSLVEQYLRRVRIRDVDKEWYMSISDIPVWWHPYLLVRRIIDFVLCLVLGIPFLVSLPLIALAIKLDSPGPVLIRQRRVGQFGRPLHITKLRTMNLNSEPSGAQWAVQSDPRITRVGKLLRRTRLDEFCQLWNVLRGEMTLIGPRPERPEFVAVLARELAHYRARQMIKPGLTGWAQVRHGYTGSVQEATAKLEYDLYYVKNQSIALDLQILALTVFTILGLRGR